MQYEALRHMRQLRLDDVPPQPNHLRLVIDECAAARENLTRRSATDLKPRLLENPERGHENPLHLFGAQDLQWRPAIRESWQRRKRRPRGTRGAATLAAAGGSPSFAHALTLPRSGPGEQSDTAGTGRNGCAMSTQSDLPHDRYIDRIIGQSRPLGDIHRLPQRLAKSACSGSQSAEPGRRDGRRGGARCQKS